MDELVGRSPPLRTGTERWGHWDHYGFWEKRVLFEGSLFKRNTLEKPGKDTVTHLKTDSHTSKYTETIRFIQIQVVKNLKQ